MELCHLTPTFMGHFKKLVFHPGWETKSNFALQKAAPELHPIWSKVLGEPTGSTPGAIRGAIRDFFHGIFLLYKWGIFPIWRPRILKITVGSWLLRWFQGAFIRLVWLPGTFHFWWMFYGRWLLTSTALILQAILWDESSSMVRDPAFASKSSAVVDWNINGNVAC